MLATLTSPRILLFTLLLPIFYAVDKSWLPKQYTFSPAKLQSISQNAISIHGSSNTTALLATIHAGLRAEYGDLIIPTMSHDQWFFNNAGGCMGTMIILHASITEYLIFFGTALQTEGHSGVHMADDYFTILEGEQKVAYPWMLDPIVFKPGDQNHLVRGDSFQYAMPEKCFALELAQGWIPAMLPFGFADTFSSTLDFGNLWRTVKWTGWRMGEQALRGKF